MDVFARVEQVLPFDGVSLTRADLVHDVEGAFEVWHINEQLFDFIVVLFFIL